MKQEPDLITKAEAQAIAKHPYFPALLARLRTVEERVIAISDEYLAKKIKDSAENPSEDVDISGFEKGFVPTLDKNPQFVAMNIISLRTAMEMIDAYAKGSLRILAGNHQISYSDDIGLENFDLMNEIASPILYDPSKDTGYITNLERGHIKDQMELLQFALEEPDLSIDMEATFIEQYILNPQTPPHHTPALEI